VQLKHKSTQVRDAIERIGHQHAAQVDGIIPADRTYAYRNKLEYSWTDGPDGASTGFHRAGRWDDVLPIDVCLLTDETGNEARRAVEAWARAHALPGYDRRGSDGFLRLLVVRSSDRTGELLLTLVTTSDRPLPTRAGSRRRSGPACPAWSGCSTPWPTARARARSGSRRAWSSGADWYEERLLDLRLRVSAGAFLQTNTEMCERLYELAIEEAGSRGRRGDLGPLLGRRLDRAGHGPPRR
jgi:23S rRNA (uracil1939-C5)-methyltransferase